MHSLISFSGAFFLVGVCHPSLCALLQSVSLVLFFPLIFILTGWTVYHQTSERVTYKSSSKPRTRFLSGPVSLSICLYLFFSISPHSFPFCLYFTSLLYQPSLIYSKLCNIVDLLSHYPNRPPYLS